MKIYRQGDVLLIERTIPKTAQKYEESEEIILAEGEATGHHHAVNNITKNAALFFDKNNNNNKIYLMILKPSELKHEEHAKIDLPIGNYEVIKQREYRPDKIVNVRD